MANDQSVKNRKERGIALVSVLWVLALLSMMAAAAMSTSRLFATLERTAARAAEADAVVEAGINRAVIGLIDKRAEERWRVDGISQAFEFEGDQVTVVIQDELGKFDINAIDDQQIKSIFQSGGLDEDTANVLARRVVAWRSPENQSASGDAQAAGTHHPRYGPFQSIDELKLVQGMTPELFGKIEQAITVYSRRPTIDPAIAPRAALLALPGVDRNRIDEILEERLQGDSSSESKPGVLDPNVPLAGRVFTISVSVEHQGSRAQRTAVVQITTDPKRPYLVLDWR